MNAPCVSPTACGSSNTVPDYVPTANYVEMVNTALELGGYPDPGAPTMVGRSRAG